MLTSKDCFSYLTGMFIIHFYRKLFSHNYFSFVKYCHYLYDFFSVRIVFNYVCLPASVPESLKA